MNIIKVLSYLQILTNSIISQSDIAKILNITRGGFNVRLQRDSNATFKEEEIKKLENHYGVQIHGFSTFQKSEKQIEIEKALSERNTFGQRFNYLQGESNSDDNMLSQDTGIKEGRIEKFGLNKELPTLEELKILKPYFEKKLEIKLSFDLLVFGEIFDNSTQSDLTPEELIVLKKLARKNL